VCERDASRGAFDRDRDEESDERDDD